MKPKAKDMSALPTSAASRETERLEDVNISVRRRYVKVKGDPIDPFHHEDMTRLSVVRHTDKIASAPQLGRTTAREAKNMLKKIAPNMPSLGGDTMEAFETAEAKVKAAATTISTFMKSRKGLALRKVLSPPSPGGNRIAEKCSAYEKPGQCVHHANSKHGDFVEALVVKSGVNGLTKSSFSGIEMQDTKTMKSNWKTPMNEHKWKFLDNKYTVLFAFMVVILTTYWDWMRIQISFAVAASWLALAFLLGSMVPLAEEESRSNATQQRRLIGTDEHGLDRKSIIPWSELRPLLSRVSSLDFGQSVKVRNRLNLPVGFWTVLLRDEPPSLTMGSLLRERVVRHTRCDKNCLSPLLKLRGTDMFRSERPEEMMWQDKLLLRCGLRDKPTFLINVLFPWGTYLLYFELPSWVKKFGEIVLYDSDSNEVQALKRFLLGNDEYRNPRIFVMPVVTDAKTPVRLVAPTRKEFKTSASSAPVTWSQEDENVDANGKVMAAILEIAVDCLSDKAIRTFTNFMKRYVETMTCEAALILDRPNESTCENTAAYLSFFKWDKVDLTSCAILPPKTEEEHIQIGSMYLTK